MKSNAPKFTAIEHTNTYRDSCARFSSVIGELSAKETLVQIQSCPDWNIHDLLSHVTGLCVAISQGDAPPADTQNWVDQQVISRRGLSSTEITAQWQGSLNDFSAIATSDMRLAMPLTYDLLVHEFDLHHALQNPPVLTDNEALLLAMNVAALILHGDISKAEVGSLLLVANDYEWQCGLGDVIATLDLSAATNPIFELVRLTGSRRSQSQLFAYPWQGDFERILPLLSHMELPLHDIVE
ncbi:MAG: maleylpyruvate isomerase N-terminal domain-containing protein [bacterium]